MRCGGQQGDQQQQGESGFDGGAPVKLKVARARARAGAGDGQGCGAWAQRAGADADEGLLAGAEADPVCTTTPGDSDNSLAKVTLVM